MELFEQVLLVCHEQDLLGNELFAMDSCKMPSNAAKEWSGTFKELEEKRDKIKKRINYFIDKHTESDLQNNSNNELLAREKQTIETLTKAHDKISIHIQSAKPHMGKCKKPAEVKSNITDNESAKMHTSHGTSLW